MEKDLWRLMIHYASSQKQVLEDFFILCFLCVVNDRIDEFENPPFIQSCIHLTIQVFLLRVCVVLNSLFPKTSMQTISPLTKIPSSLLNSLRTTENNETLHLVIWVPAYVSKNNVPVHQVRLQLLQLLFKSLHLAFLQHCYSIIISNISFSSRAGLQFRSVLIITWLKTLPWTFALLIKLGAVGSVIYMFHAVTHKCTVMWDCSVSTSFWLILWHCFYFVIFSGDFI